MLENVNLEVFGAFGVVIVVMGLWLQSVLKELQELKDDHERLQQEYINHLKANNQRKQLLDAEVLLGERLSHTTRHRYATIDTQRIPTEEEIRRASEGN